MVANGLRGFAIALVVGAFAQTTDHYATLGVAKTATLTELRKAYRARALASHPDKAKPGEEEVATEAFRRVAEAYETLSDPQARRQYDAGGGRGGASFRGGGQHGGGSGGGWSAEWSWGSGGSRQQQYTYQWHHGRPQHASLRPEVRRAQERPIKLRSLAHLRATALSDAEVTERALLIALVDGSEQCARTLKFEAQFPFPFAGWSSASMGTGLWWEDQLQTYTGDIKADPQLGELFGVGARASCPTFVFVRRGKPLSAFETLSGSAAQGWRGFSDWVWAQLATTVTIRNLHSAPVQIWWATDRTAHKLALLQPGEVVEQQSFLSHKFFAWDAQTGGSTLADDAVLISKTLTSLEPQEMLIRTRCVDGDGTCGYWKQLGECARNAQWMRTKCPRSCGRCPAEGECVDKEASCAGWAHEGFCQSNPSWMLVNCARSCGACPAESSGGASRKDEL